MKLAGPKRSIRFILEPRGMRVVVGGIFPPEGAAAVRANAEEMIPSIEPRARAAYDNTQRQFNHEMMYGRPGALRPQGILRGEHWFNARPI